MQPITDFIRRFDRMDNLDLPEGFARNGSRKGVVTPTVNRLPDGSVEIRGPEDRELRIAAAVIKEGDKVNQGAPLLLVDSSDFISHKMLSDEIKQLERHLGTAKRNAAHLILRRRRPKKVPPMSRPPNAPLQFERQSLKRINSFFNWSPREAFT